MPIVNRIANAGRFVSALLFFSSFGLAAVSIAGCGGSTNAIGAYPSTRAFAGQSPQRPGSRSYLQEPALVGFDNVSESLEYWPIQPGGSSQPTAIGSPLGIETVGAMAADATTLAIASVAPSQIIRYNLTNQASTLYPDPGGPPIDITMAKGETMYVLNANNIAAFPLDRLFARTVTCPVVTSGVAITADDQSDVFVNGSGPGSFTGVAELPVHSLQCVALNLLPEQGIPGGIGVDPVNDDLVVIDNPGSCVGSGDGRMTIYPPPYSPNTATQVNLNAAYCAGTFRFDAQSKSIFLMDSLGSNVQIDRIAFPQGRSEGVYSGGIPGGFITVPNALPN